MPLTKASAYRAYAAASLANAESAIDSKSRDVHLAVAEHFTCLPRTKLAAWTRTGSHTVLLSMSPVVPERMRVLNLHRPAPMLKPEPHAPCCLMRRHHEAGSHDWASA
jgi:hypothetical protein